MRFDDDLNACAALVQRADPDRFLAAMSAPVAARAVLFPLYAFNVEVARAPWVTQEPMIAEMRLQWWRDVLGDIAAASPPRRHEIVTPLARVLRPDLAADLDDLVTARYWDINKKPFTDTDELDRYLSQSSGLLMSVAARALGAENADAATDLGYASGLANWFLAVPALRARGLEPLPDVSLPALRALAQNGLTRLTLARAARASIPARAAPALLAGWQTGPILRRAAAAPARITTGKLAQSEARKRLTLLWRSTTGRW